MSIITIADVTIANAPTKKEKTPVKYLIEQEQGHFADKVV